MDEKEAEARPVMGTIFLVTLGHCEIWRHFTRTLYFHSPSARDNTVATREISCHWRASEASETLSGLFNRESHIYYYILYYGTCKFCSYNP